MSISYPIILPAQGFRSIRMSANDIVSVAASPFTGQQQVQAHQGQFWRADVAYPPMKQDGYADDVTAALVSLRGQYGTFLLGDSSRKTPRGALGGIPVIDGAGQTGITLNTAGWSVNTVVLKAGDYIQLGPSNSLKYSEDFTNAAWVKSSVTVTGDYTLGPNGLMTADRLQAGATDSSVYQIFPEIGQFVTASVWLKSESGTVAVQLQMSNASAITATKTISVSTSWTRFEITSGEYPIAFVIGGSNSFSTGEILNAWGSQANLGFSPDGYIPTTSAVITNTRRLHKLTRDAWSNGSGLASLEIWPRLRESPTNGISTSRCVGTFRLASNERSWDVDEAKVYGVSFSAVEAI